VGGRGTIWLIGALSVVLAGLLTGIVLLAGSADSADEELTAAQQEVAAAARAEALAFLTVDHRTMDVVVERVLDGATGDFREQYESQSRRLTREATRTRATSAGEVVALGVSDLGDDSATVLVAANSTVTNTRTEQPQVRYYRLELGLVREDDRWLTSSLRFVR
jgi:Mce-associated membrane protein